MSHRHTRPRHADHRAFDPVVGMTMLALSVCQSLGRLVLDVEIIDFAPRQEPGGMSVWVDSNGTAAVTRPPL
jgi:hypothetical protein